MKRLVWITMIGLLLSTPLTGASVEVTSTGKAADLRRALNVLLSEHVFLATNATAAALGGRDDDFLAVAWAIDANSLELSQAIGSVYGKAAGEKFLVGWRTHIRFFVNYTKGVATKDSRTRAQAVADLNRYAHELGIFLHGANPALSVAAVEALMREHVTAITRAIDAQGAGKLMDAYKAIRMAGAHSHTIADPIAESIVKQFPEKFR